MDINVDEREMNMKFIHTTFDLTKDDFVETVWTVQESLSVSGDCEICSVKNGDCVVAAKIFEITKWKRELEDKVRNEIRIFRSLKHEHIVPFIDYFMDSDYYVILMDLCEKNMYDLLKEKGGKLNEKESILWCRQLLSALTYLHDNRVLHRDVKPENLLIKGENLLLGDFGLSYKLTYKSEKVTTLCGTPNYVAPEVLNMEPYTFSCDIWSFGVVFFELLTGHLPFTGEDEKTTFSNIRKVVYTFPTSVIISDKTKDLIRKIFVKDIDERLTLDEVNSLFIVLSNEIVH